MFGVWAWCRGGLNDQRCAAVGQGVGDADGALPSAVWVMVGAVYGGGGALLAVTGLAALLTPILPTTHARAALAHVAGNIQAAAGEGFIQYVDMFVPATCVARRPVMILLVWLRARVCVCMDT